MKKYLTVLIVLALGLETHARLMRSWSYQQLNDEAALIVIATPTNVTATSERTPLPNIQAVHNNRTKTELMGAGVETTFEVLTVLKGESSRKTFVLHHFSLANPDDAKALNGPFLVSFEPKGKKRYLLFLQKEADGRFAAVSGQTDPAVAIKELDGCSSP